MSTTKKDMLADIRYIRAMLRRMEAGIKSNDFATVIDCANEASCAAVQVMQEAADRSGLEMP